MTAIKMCGITRIEDAGLAADLGVQAVGFILWPGSPRHIGIGEVAHIVSALPPFVAAVGVFVSPTSEQVAQAAVDGGIGIAQIHGEVPAWPDGRPPVRILRAVRLAPGGDAMLERPVDDGDAVLLDAHDTALHGGTGRTVDWRRAAAVALRRPVVLAGGLTPVNVGDAIAIVRPYAVDVASGVEASPGVKDHVRMRHFVEAVRRADAARWSSSVEEIQ